MSVNEGEGGRGELNNAASWDDFPNGRFGDFKSPAFGDQDPWGGSGISVGLITVPRLAFSMLTCSVHRGAKLWHSGEVQRHSKI